MGELANKGYETGLIAILLKSSLDVIIDARSQLSINDFIDAKNNVAACLFGIIGSLASDGRELNNSNIASELAKYKNVVARIGGDLKILETIDLIRDYDVNPDEYQIYINEIKKYSSLRQAKNKATEMISIIDDSEKVRKMTLDDVLGLPERMFVEVTGSRKIDGENISEGIDYFKNIKEEDIGKIVGIPSKFDSINKVLLGYEPGLMYIYSGLTGKGKSMFLLNEANYIGIDLQIPTLYIDTEMTKKQVQIRLISMRSGLSQREIKRGYFKKDPEKVKKFDKAVEEIRRGKLIRIGLDEFDAEYINRIIRYYIVKENIQCAVFDYIKIPQIVSNGLNQTQMLGNLTDSLKNKGAKKNNIPLITACQAKDDLSEADSKYMRKLADVVGFWNSKTADEVREKGLQYGDYYLQFHKFRDNDNSELPRINFQFNGLSSEIVEANNDQLSSYDDF